MPLMPGKKPEVIRKNIHEMVKAGHKPKQAIAAALAHARKTAMADGGMVEEDDLDGEHERGLTELMIEGDQPPVDSPKTQDMEKHLAMNLHKESEEEEYYAMGGMVEGSDGDEEPEVMHDGLEDDYKSKKPSHEDHEEIDGVPMVRPSGLSEQAKRALEMHKKRRKFRP